MKKTDLLDKRSNLTPEQRALLQKRLKGGGKTVKSTEASQPSLIPRRPAEGVTPLTFAQQRMWFLDLLDPGNKAYNIPNAVRMVGKLRLDVLEQSLNEIVKRHESLRTTFAKADGEPVQVIAEEAGISIPILPVDGATAEEREARLLGQIAERSQRAFDLSQGPLLRPVLFQLSEEEHVLLLVMHHVISDGWSMAVLIREMLVLYHAFYAGQPSPLPELPVQYGDFAHWQRQAEQMESLSSQIAYWRGKLSGQLPVLQLPTARTRPEVVTVRGAVHRFALSKGLTEALNTLSQREGATLYMILLAAYNLLLYRATGQDDLLVGSPIANRMRQEIEGLIGLFVNTLVMRNQISPDQTARQFLHQVRTGTLEAYEHQDVPFEMLVQEVQPERNRSFSPLFQAMFVLHNNQKPPLQLPELTLDVMDIENGSTAQFDLMLDMEETAEGMQAKFKYNANLYDAQVIAMLAAQFEHLLGCLTEDIERPIAELTVALSDSDQTTFAEMNGTEADYDLDQLLLDAFTERAEAEPNRIALSYEGQTMTYGELLRRSNQVAHFLRGQGVGRNQLVGILMERGLEMMVGLYGIVRAGAAYVPIDPEYPAQRVQYMLADSGAQVLLTKQAFLPQVAEIAGELTALQSILLLEGTANGQGRDLDRLAMYEIGSLSLADTTPEPSNEPTDIAYMIYTSGSTGQPKGAQVSHRAIVNRLLWHQEQFQATARDVIAQRTSVCFDVSVWELFWALRHGAAISILPSHVVKDPYRMHDHIKREQVTVMHFVPSLFSLFVSSLQNIDAAQRALPALRAVVTSGEALPDKPVQLWFEMFPDGTQIVNLYGPTEAAVDVTCYVIDRKPERSILIGKPIANTQLYVLDPQGRQCPVMVKGELYIGGVQLAEGYHNKPDKTAEAFVKNHLPGAPGERLYRTGDLARVLPDGNIEYLGRIDSQVKVRGYRIEMGEIENALIQHPAVENAAVIVRKGPDGNNMLVGFYACKQGQVPGSELKGFLAAKMPDYMVPAFLHPVDKIPLSPNGKADRRALAELNVEDSTAAAARYVAPVNEIQEQIAAIWKQVLGREQISIHDNFFDIGGHSLLVVKVHDALTRELGYDIQLTDLFQYTTIKAIADAVAGPEPETAESAESAVSVKQPGAGDTDIAIIGIGLRFPDADTPDEFWQNLCAGRESIERFGEEDQELYIFNQDPVLKQKLVRAGAFLDRPDLFDADFFQMSEREATLMDPQQRLFLMCVWEAIEDAGYNVDEIIKPVSLYAGAGMNQYLPLHAFGSTMADMYQSFLASQPSFMATRVSYKLNLTGESMMVNTACSTSLVTVHMACQSLISGQSDYALAGGVSLQVPQKTGYLYEENFIMSPDGYCRAFDKDAAGTVLGNGAGVVLLKRLSDAVRDGDPIYAVIKGTAINNDGNLKIGYTAPSIQGQAKVIAKAQAAAGIDPDTITYIEAHGTGTKLGDPIEVSALSQVFRKQTQRRQYCALGTVKTNIGHLDTAAGIAGLIKTALSIKHGQIPPSLHYHEANPGIDFANTPFYVNTALRPWQTEGSPRRAGVSSFGIGGTNAHAILEEAPATEYEEQHVRGQLGETR